MILKKASALTALLTIAALLFHIAYNAWTFLAMKNNSALMEITKVLPMVCVCIHAMLGMLSVFLQSDGTRTDLYPKENRRTILLRVSAALILPLLVIHIQTFTWLMKTAQGGQWFLFGLLILAEVLFFATVFTHVCCGLTRALITLGWLTSRETQKKIDRTVWVIGALLFAAASVIVIRGQLMIFVH